MLNPLFNHVYRDQTLIVDQLAHFGTKLPGRGIRLFEKAPLFVKELMKADQEGVLQPRFVNPIAMPTHRATPSSCCNLNNCKSSTGSSSSRI